MPFRMAKHERIESNAKDAVMTTMQALVLVHGGAGGVGFVAVQLARALGATLDASSRR
jgi:NADPH:quinone reductase-like Zn-dependent oxidoreductase